MRRYNTMTPEGIRDLLFEECVARRTCEKNLRHLFAGCGYNEVVTAGLEYYDVFSEDNRHFPQEAMYKLTDTQGRLLVCRPDSTAPIARLVATRLREEPLPIRLFYNQDVYQMTKSLSGRNNEIVQMGIELIGASTRRADLEVICIALDALRACNSADFRFEIGHIGFFNALSKSLPVNDDVREEIRTLVEAKNYAALGDLLDRIGNSKGMQALKKLPSLFGGIEVIDQAMELFSSAETSEILGYLKDLYREIEKLGLKDKVIIDLGLVHRREYYTGVVFRGYIQGYGEQVLSGGRYDALLSDFGRPLPAVGFGADITAIVAALARSGRTAKRRGADALVYAEPAYQIDGLVFLQELTARGLRCENALTESLDEATAYARQKGIAKLYYVHEKTEKIIL